MRTEKCKDLHSW